MNTFSQVKRNLMIAVCAMKLHGNINKFERRKFTAQVHAATDTAALYSIYNELEATMHNQWGWSTPLGAWLNPKSSYKTVFGIEWYTDIYKGYYTTSYDAFDAIDASIALGWLNADKAAYLEALALQGHDDDDVIEAVQASRPQGLTFEHYCPKGQWAQSAPIYEV
jgi:hypothetical protein